MTSAGVAPVPVCSPHAAAAMINTQPAAFLRDMCLGWPADLCSQAHSDCTHRFRCLVKC